MIDASRDFVCVRLNAWLDEVHVQRVIKLQGFHQNSALALLEPDARGVAVDDFPGKDDCFWGPFDFSYDSNQDAPWEAVHERADVLPVAMKRLAALAPGRPTPPGGPLLPVFPDLKQVLNIAACDSRAVVVEVVDGERREAFDARLAPLLLEPPVAGRAHAVRVTPAAWRAAAAVGQVRGVGAKDGVGLYVVRPDPYGLEGEVLVSARGVPSAEVLRDTLHEGLARFTDTFVKKDRSRHIVEGRAAGVRWEEVDARGWKKGMGAPETRAEDADGDG